jgi:heme/copper-type cytochrome/quinol oxidase subunit 2
MIFNALMLGEVAQNVEMVDRVFWVITWVCIVTLVGVTGTMLYFMVRYRRRGDEIGADIHGSTSLEIAWTVIPTIIVMIMFWYGWKGFEDLRAQPEGALEIQVVGGQWNWNYTYEGIKKGVKWEVADVTQSVLVGYVTTSTREGVVSMDLKVSRFESEMTEAAWKNLVPSLVKKEEWEALSKDKDKQGKLRTIEQKRILDLTPPKGQRSALLPTAVESDGPRWVVFRDGPNRGQKRAITSFDRKTGSIGWEKPLEEPCSEGDRFEIKGRLIRSILYVPVDRNVILRLNSVDVLHSYYIPEFRTKEDAVPGLNTFLSFHATETGMRGVWCAEYCGAAPEPDPVADQWLGHHNMLSTVWVVSEADYDQWVAHKGELPMETIVNNSDASSRYRGDPGLAVLQKNQCLTCHTLDSSEEYAPSFVGMFGAKSTVITNGKKREVEIDADYIRRSIEDPDADIVEEFEGRRMKMFPTKISDEELSQIVLYLKGLK